jgi:superfamily II DNA or RNA helicase
MFDENIKFAYTWRDYQARVLKDAQQYVDDGHIHIVAAPGSGKTVLGLELMRRINMPTIILAPTIAIRNQWAERFTTLFMNSKDGDKLPEWLSLDVNKPAKLTIITYQGLYSVLAGKKYKQQEEAAQEQAEDEGTGETIIEAPEEPETPESESIILPEVEFDTPEAVAIPAEVQQAPKPEVATDPRAKTFLETLNKFGVRTIIVDEAHHLRNDWWRSLNDLKAGLQQPVVVALTATPPYDSEPAEWKKYQSFCGPIDIEVPVPELVGKKDLCPHQDYVYLSRLSSEEENSVKKVKARIKAYIDALQNDQQFIAALLAHPVFNTPDMRERWVFEYPEYFTAIGSFLLSVGHKNEAKPLLRMISGRSYGRMPKFNETQAELLLGNALYRDDYFALEENKELLQRLREEGSRAGVIDARQVSLTNNKALSTILRNSVSKLDSIQRIVTFEQAAFGSSLRCVVLTDFIRKEFLPPYTGALNKHGVVPIFEKLRTTIGKTNTKKIGILSGVIVVIPEAAKDKFRTILQEVAEEIGASTPKVSFRPYPGDDAYLLCAVSDQTRQFVVRTVTQLFEAGEIEILVGTKSLLGEGWDAPAINSLVLASFVGTFMLSNQMRGRAIRIDKRQPQKVANIWHVATVLPGARQIVGPLTVATNDLGPEYDLLDRRFETFVGVSSRHDSIESGLNRALFLERGPYEIASLEDTIERANHQTFDAARDKAAIAERWQRALAGDEVGQLVHTTQMEQPKLPRSFVYGQTLKAAMLALLTNWITFMQSIPSMAGRSSSTGTDPNSMLVFVVTIFALFSIFTIFRFFWYALLALRHYSPENSMEQVGQAVLHALHTQKYIKTPVKQLKVIATKTPLGTVSCGLKGGSTYENDLFLDCLEEMLSPIANPRYLLQSGGKYRFFTAGYNNYSVPAILAQHKKSVLVLLAAWKKRVGPCRGVYTRTQEGRRMLLKARRESLSGRLSPRSTRHSVWK